MSRASSLPARTPRVRAAPSSRGFSLIEVLVALTILTAGVLFMGSTLSVTSRASRDSLDATVAEHLIRHKVAELGATRYDALASGAESITLDEVVYTRRWIVTPDSPRPGVTTIDVEVTWSDYVAPHTGNPLSQPVIRTFTNPVGAVTGALDDRGRTLSRSMSVERHER